MKRLFALILVLFACTSSANDFSVVINGSFPGAEGEEIRLMQYGDLITYRHVEIADTIVDNDGLFSFKLQLFEPAYIFYRIDHVQTGHYVEPGNTYNIEFEPVDFDALDSRRNPYIEPWSFSFELYDENKTPDWLNLRIAKFDSIFDEFLLEHFSHATVGRLSEPIRENRKLTDSIFEDDLNNSSFLKDYYEYKYAKLYRMANIKRPPYIFNEYIINKPVRYNNTQYMDFFNRVFDKYLVSGSRHIAIFDLTTSVNRHNSYYALMDSLGKDPILRNELLRELVMLQGLKNMYNDPEYRQSNVLSIINYVKDNSKFPQHREIAGNMIKALTHLDTGTSAPGFELHNVNGDTVSLEELKGKFVLINFFTTWCIPCLAEFSVMEDLYKEHNDRFEFISVSNDRDTDAFERFVNDNDFAWNICHFNRDFRLLDNYKVRRYPLFILIDPEGNIIDNSAPFPSRGLHSRIARILHDWNMR